MTSVSRRSPNGTLSLAICNHRSNSPTSLQPPRASCAHHHRCCCRPACERHPLPPVSVCRVASGYIHRQRVPTPPSFLLPPLPPHCHCPRRYFPATFEADGCFTHATHVTSRLLETANHFYQDVPGPWVCLQISRAALRKAGIFVSHSIIISSYTALVF